MTRYHCDKCGAVTRSLREAIPLSACPAHTRDGTRCTLETGHTGAHVTGYGGWFRADGEAEQVIAAAPGVEGLPVVREEGR